MVDTGKSGNTASLLRVGRDDIKALRKRIGNQTQTTVIDRCKDLACTRGIGPARTIGIHGLLDKVAKGVGASLGGAPARLGGGRLSIKSHNTVYNTKECLYKVAAARSTAGISVSRNFAECELVHGICVVGPTKSMYHYIIPECSVLYECSAECSVLISRSGHVAPFFLALGTRFVYFSCLCFHNNNFLQNEALN